MNFKNLLSTAVFAALLIATSIPSFGQSDRYSLTLDDAFVTSLKNAGSLVSTIKDASRNTIGVIELRYADTKDNDPVDLNLDVKNVEDAAVIILDEDILAKIKGQPIRIPVSNPQFSRVLLRYDAPAVPNEPAMNSMMSEEGLLFVRLSDTKSMAGKVEGFDTFELKTAFGPVSIPMDQIAGIKLHTDTDDAAVVVMTNGDSVTGAPSLAEVKLVTDWGQADIDPKYIQSMTTTYGAKFQQSNSDFGTRWILNTGTSFAPGALGTR